jgi:hypothetical protein
MKNHSISSLSFLIVASTSLMAVDCCDIHLCPAENPRDNIIGGNVPGVGYTARYCDNTAPGSLPLCVVVAYVAGKSISLPQQCGSRMVTLAPSEALLGTPGFTRLEGPGNDCGGNATNARDCPEP